MSTGGSRWSGAVACWAQPAMDTMTSSGEMNLTDIRGLNPCFVGVALVCNEMPCPGVTKCDKW